MRSSTADRPVLVLLELENCSSEARRGDSTGSRDLTITASRKGWREKKGLASRGNNAPGNSIPTFGKSPGKLTSKGELEERPFSKITIKTSQECTIYEVRHIPGRGLEREGAEKELLLLSPLAAL